MHSYLILNNPLKTAGGNNGKPQLRGHSDPWIEERHACCYYFIQNQFNSRSSTCYLHCCQRKHGIMLLLICKIRTKRKTSFLRMLRVASKGIVIHTAHTWHIVGAQNILIPVILLPNIPSVLLRICLHVDGTWFWWQWESSWKNEVHAIKLWQRFLGGPAQPPETVA